MHSGVGRRLIRNFSFDCYRFKTKAKNSTMRIRERDDHVICLII